MTSPMEKVSVTKVAETATEKPLDKPAEKRRALGRGLESLLPGPRVVTPTPPTTEERQGTTDSAPPEGAATVVALQATAARSTSGGQTAVEIPIEQIDRNPHQTRMDFDNQGLQELADSIRLHGVLQAIVVRPGDGGHYTLILGERRLRASSLAGRATIPAIVKRVSEQQAAEMTIVENLQRQDLNCMEQAHAFARLSSHFKLTQEEIGKRVGASRETVSNYLRLLRLPSQIETYLLCGDLSFSHARELLMLDDPLDILKAGETAVRKKLTVAALERLVWDMKSHPPEEKANRSGGPRWVDPNVRAAQRQLETILGMRVWIRDRRGKGKITIEYATLEDFDRVVGMLKEKKSNP